MLDRRQSVSHLLKVDLGLHRHPQHSVEQCIFMVFWYFQNVPCQYLSVFTKPIAYLDR